MIDEINRLMKKLDQKHAEPWYEEMKLGKPMKPSTRNNKPISLTIATLIFTYSFSTETSTSFNVASGLFRGWVDVHYPCQSHIKLQIRGALPEEYLTASKIKEVVSTIQKFLEIPTDETFEAVFFKPAKIVQMSKSTDRQGQSDRIDTSRSFNLPKED